MTNIRPRTALSESFCQDAAAQLTLARATAVAACSVQKRLLNSGCSVDRTNLANVGLIVHSRHMMMELEMISRQAQLKFMEILRVQMSEEEKIATIFEMYRFGIGSPDQTEQTLSAKELARAMRKMGAQTDMNESIRVATNTIAAFDENNDSVLNLEEFGQYLKFLGENLHDAVSFDDLCQYLAMHVGFPEQQAVVLDDVMEAMELLNSDDGPAEQEQSFRKLRLNPPTEARLLLLFLLFDDHQEGHVRFSQVSKHLKAVASQVTSAPHREAIDSLLMQVERQNNNLDYRQFVYLMINVVTCSNETTTFPDLCNQLTLTVSREYQTTKTKTDIPTIDEEEESYDPWADERTANDEESLSPTVLLNFRKGDEVSVLSMGTDKEGEDDELAYVLGHSSLANLNPQDFAEKESIDACTKKRLRHLFHAWDLNGDGYIDLSELVLGWHKFHEAHGGTIDNTMRECIEVLVKVDEDQNRALDQSEFASLFVAFAKSINIDLHELIDFMVVHSTLRDAKEEVRQQYVESIQQMAPEKIIRRHSSRSQGGLVFSWLKSLRHETVR